MALFKKKGPNHIKDTFGDRVFQVVTTIFLVIILIAVAYPVIYVVSCSLSSDVALDTGKVLLWPVDITLDGYKFVFQFERIWLGYRNTIFYTIFGVTITMVMQILAAYPLSRPHYQGRGFFMKVFFFTTMFSAGMIPTYMVRSALGMVNTIWAVLLASVVGVSNVIILRTAFRSNIPSELYDAASIDGASDFQTMVQVALPLVKATISTLMLYAAVGCWNDYFNAMIYLRHEELYPLQLFLRTILTTAQSLDASAAHGSAQLLQTLAKGIKQIQFALIIVATVPVLVLYFVVQKSFKKGVMIGSVKG